MILCNDNEEVNYKMVSIVDDVTHKVVDYIAAEGLSIKQ